LHNHLTTHIHHHSHPSLILNPTTHNLLLLLLNPSLISPSQTLI
jgi:hypothetical protein